MKMGIIISSILQMRRLRQEGLSNLPQVAELARKGQRQELTLNLGSLALASMLFFYHILLQGQEGPTGRER